MCGSTHGSLTTVSQQQFWSEFDMSRYGDGTVDDILSVCVSDWDTDGVLHQKLARECTPEEIKEEVWAQLEAHVNDDDRRELDAANIVDWHLDPDAAVNGILEQSGRGDEPCAVWEYEEPAVFAPIKAYDLMRYRLGLPHAGL